MTRRSLAVAIAASMSPSLTSPSATRRWGRPCRAWRSERGGGGEVVHGRGIESSVSGHFDRFVILTGGQEQLLNRLGLSASRRPAEQDARHASRRRDSTLEVRGRQKKEPPHEAGAHGIPDLGPAARGRRLSSIAAARRKVLARHSRRRRAAAVAPPTQPDGIAASAAATPDHVTVGARARLSPTVSPARCASLASLPYVTVMPPSAIDRLTRTCLGSAVDAADTRLPNCRPAKRHGSHRTPRPQPWRPRPSRDLQTPASGSGSPDTRGSRVRPGCR